MRLKSVHHDFDIAWQPAGPLQDGALIRAEGHKLQSNRQAAFKGVLGPKQLLDHIIEVDAASLELGTHGIIDTISPAMFDLMAQFEKEIHIVLHSLFVVAARIFQTLPQLPKLIRATRRLDDNLLSVLVLHMPIINALTFEPSVQQVRPGNHGGNDKQLGSESQSGAVE